MTPTQEAIVRVRADLACGTALISNTESARDLRLVLTAAEEAERLRADAERLDWLAQDDGRYHNIDRITAIVGEGFNRLPSLRAAIDAARALTAAPLKTTDALKALA